MMDVRAIHNADDYRWALTEIEKYFDNQPAVGSPDADRFDVLAALIKEYEDREIQCLDVDPVDVLHFAIESMGKTQADLGRIIGRSRATEILKRHRRLTLDMIRDISREWNLPINLLTGQYELEKAYA
jgi:HTH-type transcriptional regulator/antitoxin HigA